MLLSTTVKKSHTVTKKGCDDTRSAPLGWPSCSHIHVHVHSPQIKVLRWTRAMAPSVCTQTHLCPGKPTSQRATGTPCSCTSLRRPSLPASTVCVSSEARGAIPTLCSFQGRMLIVCGDFHAVKNFMPINGNSVHVGVPMGRRKRERRGGGVHMFVHICTIRSCSEGKRPDGEVDSFAFKVQLSDYVYAAIGQLVPGMFEHTKATCRMVAQNSISLLSCIK